MFTRIKTNYNHTIYACYIGYIVQATIVNFLPLLFVTLKNTYGFSASRLSFLITASFGIQLITDAVAARFADKIGVRSCAVIAHIFSAAGFIMLAVLPSLTYPYIGIMISLLTYSVGGGLIEVVVSPIVEASPSERKEAAMSLLHSFYCWGHVAVVVLSTLFFNVFGIDNWRILALLWAIIPIFNIFYFKAVPIAEIVPEGKQMSVKDLFKNKFFYVLILLMACSGASEQGMCQWASAFVEESLGLSKTFSDLVGPCMFAICMGTVRALYGAFDKYINLHVFMLISSALCIISYLLTALTQSPLLGLVGCALCGISVGIMWPGSLSTAAKVLPFGGTAMFSCLALAGDFGCVSGPLAVGVISDLFGGNLKTGFLFTIIFPIMLIVCITVAVKARKIQK